MAYNKSIKNVDTPIGTMRLPGRDQQDMRKAVDMISRQTIDLRPLISRTFPLSDLDEALKAAIRPDTYRVIVLP